MANTWERFLQLCDSAVASETGGAVNRHDLADCVDPADYWDEGASDDEAQESAQEFARELLSEEGYPLEPGEEMDGDHASALASAGFGTDEDYGDAESLL